MSHDHSHEPRWKHAGVRVIASHQLDPNTAQPPGMDRKAAINFVMGRARMRWGDNLEFTAEAGPGDCIYVPPYVPHQEINASATEVLECVLCRSDGRAEG